jgi:hypothetical protein
MNQRYKSKDTCSPTRKLAMHICITSTVIKVKKLMTTPCIYVHSRLETRYCGSACLGSKKKKRVNFFPSSTKLTRNEADFF